MLDHPLPNRSIIGHQAHRNEHHYTKSPRVKTTASVKRPHDSIHRIPAHLRTASPCSTATVITRCYPYEQPSLSKIYSRDPASLHGPTHTQNNTQNNTFTMMSGASTPRHEESESHRRIQSIHDQEPYYTTRPYFQQSEAHQHQQVGYKLPEETFQQWQQRQRQSLQTNVPNSSHRRYERSTLPGMSVLLRPESTYSHIPPSSPLSQPWYPPPPLSSHLALKRKTSPTNSMHSTSPMSTTSVDGEEIVIAPSDVAKPSRYLREMDRRTILHRLASGEKQATLAKEYHVSRAAICNLNKHRMEVMSRSDENPFAKHPKKRKLRNVTVANVTDDVEETEESVVSVYEVKSRAIQLLLTSLRDASTSLTTFKQTSERLMRLVLEEALAMVSIETIQVCWKEEAQEAVSGIRKVHGTIAISMEQNQMHPMMDQFQMLEPHNQMTGFLRIKNDDQEQETVLETKTVLQSYANHNVFVLDVVTTSPERIRTFIQQLKAQGAIESMVYIVALFVSSEVVAMVQCKFPHVHLITTQIESSLNKWRKNTLGLEPVTAMEAMLTRWDQVYKSSTNTTSK